MINHLKHLISLAQDSMEAILISYAHDCHPGILLMSVLFSLAKTCSIKYNSRAQRSLLQWLQKDSYCN
jgi:hypothetical protein